MLRAVFSHSGRVAPKRTVAALAMMPSVEEMQRMADCGVKKNRALVSPLQAQSSSTAVAQNLGDDYRLIDELAREKSTRLSLQNLLSFSPEEGAPDEMRIRAAQFLHRELQIRFSHRIQELRKLPYGLSDEQSVRQATGWYVRIVKQLANHPVPATVEQEEEFVALIAGLLLDHSAVPKALSRAMVDLRNTTDHSLLNRVLDSFFLSRLSMRFLIEHYIASKQGSERPGFRGIVQSDCNPIDVADGAAKEVRKLCMAHLGECPDIKLFGNPGRTFTAVPSHVHFIISELLKNSCRATVEHWRARSGKASLLPPVKVIVASGREDMTIKVVDEGGGIKRSDLPLVWSYLFSSAPSPPAQELRDDMPWAPSHGFTETLAGDGMGLPLASLYARYFGGSLSLRPMESFGCEAYVHLHMLSNKTEFLLEAHDPSRH
jgi:pyruvate dehydrogenase kinase 2/3/4